MLEEAPPDLSWFPRLQAMCLEMHDNAEDEQALIRNLGERLEKNNQLMEVLKSQLNAMERNVASKRRRHHRAALKNDAR